MKNHLSKQFKLIILYFTNNRQKNKNLNKTLTLKRLKYNKSQSISGENKIEFGGKFINRDREIIYSDMLNDQYLMSEEFNYNQSFIILSII